MTTGASVLSTLESYLKLTTTREQAIAANMANVDTPGYRTRDVNFERELQRAMTAPLTEASFQMSGGGSAEVSPALKQVQGLMERPDGNNVSLDREGLLLSETQLKYQIGIQLMKHEFHGLLSAISGGN